MNNMAVEYSSPNQGDTYYDFGNGFMYTYQNDKWVQMAGNPPTLKERILEKRKKEALDKS